MTFQDPATGGAASPDNPRRNGRLAAVVVVGAVVVLGGVGAAVWALTGSDAGSVSQVADDAVAAAEQLDVDAAIDLMCAAPTAEERAVLVDGIAQAQADAGTRNPEVEYRVSEIEGDAAGSFVVHISTDEPGLQDEETYGAVSIKVMVKEDDGRSCISSFDSVE